MYEIKKGSLIRESCYGLSIDSEIISEIHTTEDGQQSFKARVYRKVMGEEEWMGEGGTINYLVNGAYGACIQVLAY